MNPLEIFKSVGAIITDTHVVYASGRHGNAYINKDAVYPHTEKISSLCEQLADKFRGRGVEVVAGPTVGGVILAQWTAHFLGQMEKKEVLAVFAEEELPADGGKRRVFKRGYDGLIRGKNVLAVEDVLTTGGSVKMVIDAITSNGGSAIGCAALVNRGGVKPADVGADITALIELSLSSWEENDCPLCRKNVPVNTNVGKGREWLAKRGNR